MSGFFYFVWFVTFIAFIVYWWKKRKARKGGGDDYKNYPEYQRISKIKRIVGAVCIVSFVLGIATTPSMTPEEKAKIAAERQAKAEKQAEEKAAKEAADKEAKQASEKEQAEKSAEEQARKAQDERDKIEKSITTGWDTTNVSSKENEQKAFRLVAENADYIMAKDPVWANPEDALRKPWDYYGKIVAFTGVVADSNQAPPGQSVAKLWGGKYTYGVIYCGDVPVGFHIKSDSEHLRVGQQVTIKGFIVGQDSGLKNNFGGSPKGVEFVGFVQ